MSNADVRCPFLGLHARDLDPVALCSIVCSTGIFATTIHSQDFKDVEGDRAVGRQTIPIMFGASAKYTVLVPLLLWSTGLSALWRLDGMTCAALVLLATWVGVQYLVGRTVHEYQVAFYWYNVRRPFFRRFSDRWGRSRSLLCSCRFG